MFVVNKADRPGAEKLRQEIEVTLGIRRGNAFRNVPAHHGRAVGRPGKRAGRCGRRGPARPPPPAWDQPVVLTVAAKGEGVEELIGALDRHHAWLAESGTLERAPPPAAARPDPRGGGPGHAPLALGRDPRRRAHRRAAGRDRGGARESVRGGGGGAGRAQTGRADMTTWDTELDAETARRLAAQERELMRLRAEVAAWRAAAGALPTRNDVDFTSVSGRAVEPVYTALDLQADRAAATGLPGEYPFTRGIHPTMYRGRLWTMRQFAGFGTAEDTNERYKFLLERGQTGLSVAFDFPDADGLRLRPSPLRGRGRQVRRRDLEPGRHGDAVRRHPARPGLDLDDDQRPGGDAVLLLRRGRGAAGRPDRPAAGHDPERHPQGVHGAARLDLPGGARAQDHRGPVRVGGGAHAEVEHDLDLGLPHPRGGRHRRAGAGVHARQRLLLRGARARPRARRRRFAPRLSFFWDVHNDFFEEIAKLRAARRIWARHMRERYGAQDPRSWRMRFHCQTAGVTLTAQQPQNNVVRVAYQALAAVLGGTQSLHTNALDETLALPTEESVRIALRTQQILAYETGVPNVVDPLGGSYYVEALTDGLEREAEGLFAEIEAQGGVVRGHRDRLVPAADRRQLRCGSRPRWSRAARTIVGVNDFVEEAEAPVEILKVGDAAEQTQRERLARVRAERDAGAGRGRGSPSCGAPPPRIATSFPPCSTAPVPTARCTRSGMCSRRFMAAIASRSSSDGRRHGRRAAGNGRGRARTAVPAVAERLARLTGVDPAPHRVVTCYLKLEPRDRSRGKYLIKLKNRVREVVAGAAAARARPAGPGGGRARPRAGAAVPARRRPISRRPRASRSSPARRIGLFEALPLPVVLPLPPRGGRARRWCASSPRSRTSSAACSRWCSTGRAPDSSRSPPTTAEELPGLRADSTRGKRFHGDQNGPGWGEHTYNNRIRTEKQRHYEAIARELFAIDRRQPAHGIVLAGTGHGGGRGRAVPPQLSGRAGHRDRAAQPEGGDAAPRCTRRRWPCARPGSATSERDAGRARCIEALGSGWSVNGHRRRRCARCPAARCGRCSSTPTPASRASAAATSGRLARTERECRDEGEPVPVLDVVDDAIEEALRQGVDVNVVYETEARDAVDGLAGLLRFR